MRPMVAKVGQAGFKRGSKEPKMSSRWRQRRPRMDQREAQGSTKGPQEAKRNQEEVKEEAREMEKLQANKSAHVSITNLNIHRSKFEL